MVPQNKYTLKHNSLTKSSSWWGAHWLLASGKYERPPYYSSKPKANELWRFENSHCGGRPVSTTHSDKVCPSTPFLRTISEKMKPCNSNPEIANKEAPKITSTPSPSMSAFSPHLRQFRHDLQQQAISELHPDSRTLLANIHKKFFLQGHMEVDRNGKMGSGRTYNWHSICLRWSDLLMQDHTFLRHSMDSNTWLSIGSDYQSLNTYSF